MYSLYKPLRNFLRTVSLLPSLRAVWGYSIHDQFKRDIPRDIEAIDKVRFGEGPLETGVFMWELDILAKELILNAPDSAKRDLRAWKHFSSAINKLKDLENETVSRYDKAYSGNILIELYRTVHRQAPWQTPPNSADLLRYYQIFSTPDIDDILLSKINLDSRTLYRLGLAVTGYLMSHFAIALPINSDLPDTSEEQLNFFFERFSTDVATLRAEAERQQSYNEDFAYTFNPLWARPLVQFETDHASMVVAPIPTLLIWRVSRGVYYDIFDAPGFSQAFGDSFQEYTGKALRRATRAKSLEVLPEASYRTGKTDKRSVDWIVSDSDACLLVECKTKRIRYDAKFALADQEPLEQELDKLSEALLQLYKSLHDALSGRYPHWSRDDRSVYPIIVTLEDWYLFSDKLLNELDARLTTHMTKAGLPLAYLGEHPYSICSIRELEHAVQIMGETGVNSLMATRTSPAMRSWHLHGVMVREFGDEYRQIDLNLFPEIMDDLVGPKR